MCSKEDIVKEIERLDRLMLFIKNNDIEYTIDRGVLNNKAHQKYGLSPTAVRVAKDRRRLLNDYWELTGEQYAKP